MGEKDGAKESDGGKSIKNHSEMAGSPMREALDSSEGFMEMDIMQRSAKFTGLHASCLTLIMMTSMFLRLLKT